MVVKFVFKKKVKPACKAAKKAINLNFEYVIDND